MPSIEIAANDISEYDRNFKWNDKEKRLEVKAPFAGKESSKMLRTEEPPLQHKRRNYHPQDNITLQDNNNNNGGHNEIFLGGKKNEKFGSAIPHVIKSRHHGSKSPPIDARTLTTKSFHDDRENREYRKPTVDELRLPSEARKRIVDNPEEEKNRNDAPIPRFALTEPPKKSLEPHHRRRRARENDPERRTRENTKHYESKARRRRKEEEVRFSDYPPRRDYYRQSEDLPEDYAKRRELGLKDAKRKIKANHLTEYRRQYEARNGEHSSPLLKAEDIIFRSHLDMPKDLKVSDTTEYRRQFKKFHFTPPPKAIKPTSEDKVTVAVDKALKDRRAPRRPSPPRVVVEGEEYGPGEVLNPQRMSFPLGRQRRFLSEYEANFRDFWHKEAPSPAHLLAAHVTESKDNSQAEELARKLWFEEILDLRRRAEEYKRRARGTHFSREHVAEILDPRKRQATGQVARKAWTDEDEQSSRSELLTPRNEPIENENSQSTPRVEPMPRETASKHHLARTTPCQEGVILSPENRHQVNDTDRTASSVVIGKPRDISRTDNPAFLRGQEKFTGLRSSSPSGGPFLTAGKPTADNAFLRTDDVELEDFAEEAAGKDVIYEGFGQTYNVSPNARHADKDSEADRDSVVAADAAAANEDADDAYVRADGDVRSYASSARSEISVTSLSSARTPRGRQPPPAPRSRPPMPPPLPPQAMRDADIDDDLQSTLESVRSIVSSSSAMAEETLQRAQRNQRSNWSGH